MSSDPLSGSHSLLAERSEEAAYRALLDGAPKSWRESNGVGFEETDVGGLVLYSGVERSSLVFNRVLGAGWTRPLTPESLKAIEARYRARGVLHFVVEAAREAACGDPTPVLRAAAYMRLHSSAAMHRAVEPMPVRECGLHVRRAGAGDADAVAALSCAVFGLPSAYESLFAASARGGANRHWLAFDGDVPVAIAMTVPSLAGCDWIGWVGTLSSHRRRGAQAALTVAQLNECHALGTRAVTLEVATGTSADANASLRNYQRLGWRVVHERVTFLKRMRR